MEGMLCNLDVGSSMAATHRLEATTLSSIDGISFTTLSGHFTAETQ